MKKIINVILLVVFCIFITSCGEIAATNNTINNKRIEVEDYTISDLQDACIIASSKAEQSVVAILDQGVTSSSLGSAVVIKRVAYNNNEVVSDDSEIITKYVYCCVTNYHVIKGKTTVSYTIYLSDNTEDYKNQVSNVKVLETNSILDLAIIQFETTTYIPVATVKNSNTLKKGQLVVAIGTPISLELFNTASLGIISHPLRYTSLNEEMNYFIQHDAAINPGNSGGGLFDIEGNLIGINTWRYIDSKNEVTNLSFAIPSSIIYTNYSSYIDSYVD
mgnify:CR=1 FL=1